MFLNKFSYKTVVFHLDLHVRYGLQIRCFRISLISSFKRFSILELVLLEFFHK